MPALICGSLAYDTIMVFQDKFKHHILPDQIHILNVSFLVPDLRREYGGCAGNIAYNLKMLQGEPVIMATVGQDFAPYAERLDALGLARTHVRPVDGSFTAQAFITSDVEDNQITAFHPGAMNHSHLNRIDSAQGITIGIVSPDGRQGMIEHAEGFAAAGIPFIFDPGQGLPMFGAPELRRFVELASWVTVNDYECRMLEERIGEPLTNLLQGGKVLVTTRGAEGSTVYVDGQQLHIPCVVPDAIVDPTGCGDAYRAGLLYGIEAGWSWDKTGRLASLLGSIKIAHRGGQNHRFTRDELNRRYQAAFAAPLW